MVVDELNQMIHQKCCKHVLIYNYNMIENVSHYLITMFMTEDWEISIVMKNFS